MLFAGRGVVHTAGVILWFFAMTQIPLAEVTAMNYLSPVYVTLGASLFLRIGHRLLLQGILTGKPPDRLLIELGGLARIGRGL